MFSFRYLEHGSRPRLFNSRETIQDAKSDDVLTYGNQSTTARSAPAELRSFLINPLLGFWGIRHEIQRQESSRPCPRNPRLCVGVNKYFLEAAAPLEFIDDPREISLLIFDLPITFIELALSLARSLARSFWMFNWTGGYFFESSKPVPFWFTSSGLFTSSFRSSKLFGNSLLT